jgi:hypothetical protein
MHLRKDRLAEQRSRAQDRFGPVLPIIVLVAATVAACSSLGGLDASPTVPLITSKPYVPPEPTPTPEPTKKPLPMAEISVPESVQRGEDARVVIDTGKAAECVIEVTYDTGPSEDAGLGPKTADGEGRVSWSWTVDTTAAKGTYPIDITCFKGERLGSLALTFKVR